MSCVADVTLEKVHPNSIESECAALGAIILDHKAIFPATEVLTVDDFYLEGDVIYRGKPCGKSCAAETGKKPPAGLRTSLP